MNSNQEGIDANKKKNTGKFTELKIFFNKNVEQIQETCTKELKKHNEVISNLQTRLNNVEKKCTVNAILTEHQGKHIDNNEQYSRHHSLSIIGREKNKMKLQRMVYKKWTFWMHLLTNSR